MLRRSKRISAFSRAIGFAVFILCVGLIQVFAFQMKLSGGNYINEPQKVRAPEFKGAKGWLNTDQPLSIAGLKGKVVLLDFWTYGCVNCIHIIPDLKKLEAKYADQLVVIGVHSAKFDNEKNIENIRNIVLRYGVEHPVVNDADFKIWDAYAIRAWPSLVLIDPAGYIVGTLSGEGHYETLDNSIGKTVSEFRKNGKLDESPIKYALERAKVGELPLAYPGKVLADQSSGRLFIADSNHNRIVVTDFNGKLLETIGNGEQSKKDGDFEKAGFNKPQGMAIDGDFLYVADTENHLIRKIDLKSKVVTTIGGTGTLDGFTGIGGKPLETVMRSPWDLSLVGQDLYIAMAGSHQIWRLQLDKNNLEPYAGTRWEARTDGKIKKAAFAQPSGIVSDGKKLYVADSESNIIRSIDFEKETVDTLVGGDLFSFGDIDGRGDRVRLQHPLGVALYDGKVLIADTYNDKIKILDPETRAVETFLGTGKEGQIDGTSPTFYEPGGISVAGDKLFVADTNNQAIRVVDLKTNQTSTLKIEGLTPPVEMANDTAAFSPNLNEIDLKEKTISAKTQTFIVFNVSLPDGFHLNPDAPQRYNISFDDGENVEIANPAEKFKDLPLVIPFKVNKTGMTKLKAKLTLFYCREDNTGVCLIKSLQWNVPINVTDKGKTIDKIDLGANLR